MKHDCTTKFSLHHLYVSIWEGWENILFEHGSERVKKLTHGNISMVFRTVQKSWGRCVRSSQSWRLWAVHGEAADRPTGKLCWTRAMSGPRATPMSTWKDFGDTTTEVAMTKDWEGLSLPTAAVHRPPTGTQMLTVWTPTGGRNLTSKLAFNKTHLIDRWLTKRDSSVRFLNIRGHHNRLE